MLFAGDSVGDGFSHIIIGVVSSLSLVILTVLVLSVLLIVIVWMRRRRRRRKKKTPQLTNNVAYNIHDHEIKTDGNEAYGTVDNDVATTNLAYGTTSGSGQRDISTSTNEAYIYTDISTSDNPAYVSAQVSGTHTLVYDYATV